MNSPCYIPEVYEYFILDQKNRLEKNFQAINSWYKRLLPPTRTHLANIFLCQTLFPSVKYCATVSNIVSLCEYVSLCKILCHCVKYFVPMKYCVPVSNIMPLCQILCIYVKYCATVSNVVPLCQLLCPCVKYYATVSNILPLCQIQCHRVKTCFLTFLFFSATRCSKKRAGC